MIDCGNYRNKTTPTMTIRISTEEGHVFHLLVPTPIKKPWFRQDGFVHWINNLCGVIMIGVTVLVSAHAWH